MTAARRGGPLFSETVQSSDGIVRANRPSAGEASSSSTPMPAMALHEQGRALKQKPSRELRLGHAVRGTASEHKTKETKVSISERLTEFPNKSLTNAAGKLFCQCCAKTLQNIACTIKTHVGSDNHKTKYLKWIERNGNDEAVKQFLHNYYVENPNENMASVSPEDQLYRYRVVESMLHRCWCSHSQGRRIAPASAAVKTFTYRQLTSQYVHPED